METTKPIKDCAQCKHGHVLTRDGKPLGQCDLESTEQFAKCIENNFCLYEPKEKTKHPGGRPPKFKTPEELAEKAEGYFKWCDEHPVRIYKRKNAGASQTAEKGSGVKQDEGEMYVDRPYTKDGLALWIGVSDWHDMKDSECYQTPEFVGIIHALETRIRNQQVTGGLCGVYHPNLTARLNGISEGVQVEGNIPVQLVDDGMNDD